MQLLRSSKLLIGFGLVSLLLNLTILPVVFTGAVAGAVEDNFATYPLDAICGQDGDCDSVEKDWATSTSTRDYYAWDLTNADQVLENQVPPEYERKGPYTYQITSHKTLLEHDATKGELTYNTVNSFECSSQSKHPCDEELTQLNIQFRPQIIGATGSAVNGIMDLTKIGFASGMMDQDLNTTQAGIATADHINSMTSTIGGAGFGSYGYTAFLAADAAGEVSVILPNLLDGNPLPVANFIEGIDSALYSSLHPSDPLFNVSLLNDLGPVAFMSMGEPEALLSTIEEEPANSVSLQRAEAYGYLATEMIDTNNDGNEDTLVTDYAQTLARDWSLYIAIGLEFQSNGGGSPFTDSEDIAERLDNLLDVDFSDVDCLHLLMNGDGSDTPLGLLAKNSAGTGFGLSAFLGMNSTEAMSTFGLNSAQYEAIAHWSEGWATSVTSLQMALLGGSGTLNAGQFVNTSFGNEDPIFGGYLTYSMNQGGDWANGNALSAISLTPEQSANILYGPLGLTTSSGALLFLYGELSGKVAPGYLSASDLGTEPWGVDVIADAYDIDANSAAALQSLFMDTIFGEFVGEFLVSSFATTPYLTQSINSWLLGWHDPVNAYLASGDSSDLSVGWASLESNQTYFGSNGVANGDGTNYTICSGEKSSCDKGELIQQDSSAQLSWRNDRMAEATLGLITPEEISGATGGFITGQEDKVDVSGYAIADLTCNGEDELKGIPVNVCSTTVSATERSIQANLLRTFSLIDVIPSALPIYLGSDIEVKSEQLSGLIIAGESTTTFYLDHRQGDQMQSQPTFNDLVPVFEIKSSSEIGDNDAEKMESAIIQNQNFFTYWMNFDTPLDFIPFVMWVLTIGFISASIVRTLRAQPEDEINLTQGEEKPSMGLLQRINQNN
ncbi:MAG: hypothetical protein P8Q98_06795 [Candidatus Poseidoniaceae archaeon]|nr:hypothetical protein [Candidatus Poseidoniaceae archaeon]